MPSHAIWTSEKPNHDKPHPTNRILLKLKEGVTPLPVGKGAPGLTGAASWDHLQQKYGLTSRQKLIQKGRAETLRGPLGRLYELELPAGTDVEEAAREYAKLDGVEYAQPDYPMELYDVPNDPLYANQWALNNTGQPYYQVARLEGDFNDTLEIVSGTPDADIDANEVFEAPPDATHTVVVAIVDTGIDWHHPDLADAIWHNPGEIPDNGLDDDHNGYVDDVVGWDFCATESYPFGEDNDPTDSIMGHGTHCAGIVAASTNNAMGVAGVVPVAKIMGLKCYPIMVTSVLINAIVYAVENGADVISMSWGSVYDFPIMGDVMEFAASRGVVLVAAAGNDGREMWNWPASYPQTICVSASNSDDQITDFSTYSEFVDVCAPGLSILSLRAEGTDMYADHNEPNVHIIDSLYYLASGTSMACPHVAAVAAYLRAVSPGLNADSVRAIIRATADDYLDPFAQGDNLPGWDIYSGYGRINLNNALAAAPHLRAWIDSPAKGDLLSGIVDIIGTADGADFTQYSLDYGVGTDPSNWVHIAGSAAPVTDGVLGSWNLSELEGSYTLRLSIAGNEDRVTVFVAGGALAEITSPETVRHAGRYGNDCWHSRVPRLQIRAARIRSRPKPGDLDGIRYGDVHGLQPEPSPVAVDRSSAGSGPQSPPVGLFRRPVWQPPTPCRSTLIRCFPATTAGPCRSTRNRPGR